MQQLPNLPYAISDLDADQSIERLQKSEYINHQLVQHLAAAIYTCDANGYITFYNKAATQLWGREPELGKDLWCGSWKIFRPEDGSMMSLDECPMAKALKGRTPVRGAEIIVERPDGIRRTILPHPDPIFDRNGVVIAAVNMLVDITDLKQNETELRQSEEKLKQLTKELEERVAERTTELQEANIILSNQNKELEQFAFIASHDMQEPLRKIKTFATRLGKRSGQMLDELSKSYLTKIKNSSERMESLIYDVLNYSRLGYYDTQFVKTDLNEIMDNILSDFEVTLEEKQAVITRTSLPCISAIPLQMNQLFYNLISNSLKFCKEVEPCHLAITSRLLSKEEISTHNLDERASYCALLFTDNGIGFNPEFAEAIFNIFKRLNAKDKYEGSGIGLAICRKIVSLHKGEIFAVSEMDKGTTIHVLLPV